MQRYVARRPTEEKNKMTNLELQDKLEQGRENNGKDCGDNTYCDYCSMYNGKYANDADYCRCALAYRRMCRDRCTGGYKSWN
jgi:hypothetical protein